MFLASRRSTDKIPDWPRNHKQAWVFTHPPKTTIPVPRVFSGLQTTPDRDRVSGIRRAGARSQGSPKPLQPFPANFTASPGHKPPRGVAPTAETEVTAHRPSLPIPRSSPGPPEIRSIRFYLRTGTRRRGRARGTGALAARIVRGSGRRQASAVMPEPRANPEPRLVSLPCPALPRRQPALGAVRSVPARRWDT